MGLWSDALLTWKSHIGKVKDKCKKVSYIMRCLTGTVWGADRVALKNIYIALIRSVLDNGLWIMDCIWISFFIFENTG